MALNILVELLAPKNSKESIKYVYTRYQVMSLDQYKTVIYSFLMQLSTRVEDAAASQTQYLAPRIGAYFSVGEETKFMVFVENTALCQCSTLPSAIFLMFAAYYSFFLNYSTQAKSFMCFLQDYIFCYPDSTDRSASYLADIKHNL